MCCRLRPVTWCWGKLAMVKHLAQNHFSLIHVPLSVLFFAQHFWRPNFHEEMAGQGLPLSVNDQILSSCITSPSTFPECRHHIGVPGQQHAAGVRPQVFFCFVNMRCPQSVVPAWNHIMLHRLPGQLACGRLPGPSPPFLTECWPPVPQVALQRGALPAGTAAAARRGGGDAPP